MPGFARPLQKHLLDVFLGKANFDDYFPPGDDGHTWGDGWYPYLQLFTQTIDDAETTLLPCFETPTSVTFSNLASDTVTIANDITVYIPNNVDTLTPNTAVPIGPDVPVNSFAIVAKERLTEGGDGRVETYGPLVLPICWGTARRIQLRRGANYVIHTGDIQIRLGGALTPKAIEFIISKVFYMHFLPRLWRTPTIELFSGNPLNGGMRLDEKPFDDTDVHPEGVCNASAITFSANEMSWVQGTRAATHVAFRSSYIMGWGPDQDHPPGEQPEEPDDTEYLDPREIMVMPLSCPILLKKAASITFEPGDIVVAML